MVQPKQLLELFRSCDNSEWLGAVCRALGGQDVPYLDDKQRRIVKRLQKQCNVKNEK